MYFKSNYSLVEHSGMMHLNPILYDWRKFFFFFSSDLCTNFRIFTISFHSIYCFLSYLFGSKEITCFYSVTLLDIRTFQCVFLVMALCSLSCVSRFFFFSRSCRTSKKSAQNGGAASALMGGTKRSQSSAKAISFLR